MTLGRQAAQPPAYTEPPTPSAEVGGSMPAQARWVPLQIPFSTNRVGVASKQVYDPGLSLNQPHPHPTRCA